jgi:pimeloyl-ACP methyl ester carboxylesterase
MQKLTILTLSRDGKQAYVWSAPSSPSEAQELRVYPRRLRNGAEMSVFVLVHGSWGGGWQWRQVANALRAQGHEVYAPTLTGLGDRSHLSIDPASLTLSAHIEDILQLLYFEDLQDVILVGWSYGGAVVDGVADRVPERLRLVVNIDGEVAEEGRTLIEGWTPEACEEMHDFLEDARATGWMRPPTADEVADALPDAHLRNWVANRARPHPLATDTEPYPDTGGRRHGVPHAFIRCTEDDQPEEATVTKLRSDERWQFHELPLNHLGILYAPDEVARVLHNLA